jgi:hypothetical protein
MNIRTEALWKASGIFTLLAALALQPQAARAEQGAIRQIPASRIEITKFVVFQKQYGLNGECVAFKNTSPLAVKRVLFLYSLIDRDGTVIFSENHEAKGQFTTGALIQGGTPITCQDGLMSAGGGQVYHGAKNGSLVASVAQVDYVDGTSWHAGPDVIGTALSQPDAGARITKTLSWQPGDSTEECVTFTNAASRPIRHVQFMFSHIADDGSDVVDDPLDVRGTYDPGTTVALSCRGWNGSEKPSSGAAPDSVTPQILVFGKPARLVSWVSQVDYTDGTSWHAPAQQSAAAAAAAAEDKVDYSQSVWWPQSLDVPGSFTQEAASGNEIAKAFTRNAGLPNECVDFISRSAKPVVHVRFRFSHLDANGNVLGEEPLDVHARGGSYAAGKPQEMNCRTFDGKVILPVLWNGGSTAGEVFYGDTVSTLQVRVGEVEYADGTSWTPPLGSGT